ncbi:hypothetical protein PybrP1_004327 [[Pythium] brassicae (nom. inval.)]|nr:hypothetical protein PybrP1_004327 [[Pythium] brassicae (nom. inval.)]
MAKKPAAHAAAEMANAPDTSGAPVANEKKPSKSSSSSSSLLFVVAPLLVALLGGAWTTLGPEFFGVGSSSHDATTRALGASDASSNASNASAAALEALVHGEVPNKYLSEVAHITTQQLLVPTPQPEANCPAFAVDGDLAHVESVLGRADELRARGRVFLMLNGENEGVSLNWSAEDACLHELAAFAAQRLGIDTDILANGVKLMTQDGRALTTAAQLDALRVAHVLFDFQIWVWPGIKVGHEFVVEGCKVKTASLRPKVFMVEGFFTQAEADSIIAQGVDRLTRSPVDSPDAVDGYHSDRTSDTAFLSDNQFTRNFRVRTAKLARLPSPSFTERLQLVRYQKGQFFRKHEDYFDSKQFVPVKSLANKEYRAWTEWAAQTIRALVEAGRAVPVDFRPGGPAFPDADDTATFQHALLDAFVEDADRVDFFVEHADVEWGKWIKENLANKASDIVGPLIRTKGYMLPHLIKSWETRVGLPELQYKIPKRPLSGVTQYFRWIRWVKERTQNLLDSDPSAVLADFRPEGPNYPTYGVRFQNRLVQFVLEDTTKEELVEAFSDEWYDWLMKNKFAKDVLLEGLRTTTTIFELAVKAWTKRAGEAFAYKIPEHLHHFEPNRFVTVFMYLNDCPEGGETVFPYSKSRLVTGIQREGMDECSEGLAVPPTKLFASMFYSQTPLNEVDPSSLHGGCPPHEGVKYGANSFAWNADADEGANAWDLGDDPKADQYAEYEDVDAESIGREEDEEAAEVEATEVEATEVEATEVEAGEVEAAEVETEAAA